MSSPLFQAALQTAVAMLAFAVGVSAAHAHLGWLRRRPLLLLRSLGAAVVGVLVLAVLVIRIVQPSRGTAAALLALALSAGPVMALKRTRQPGDAESYGAGLNLVLLAVSIAWVPLALAAASGLLHRDLGASPALAAKLLLPVQLLPLVLGLAAGKFLPSLAARVQAPMRVAANAALVLLIALVLARMQRELLSLGARQYVALAALALGSLALGHLLGGPEQQTRLVLAGFSAVRFPSLAIAIAGLSLAPAEAVAAVVVYVVFSIALLALYAAVTRRRRLGDGLHRTNQLRSP